MFKRIAAAFVAADRWLTIRARQSRWLDAALAPIELPLRAIEALFPLAAELSQADVERLGQTWIPTEDYYFLDDPRACRVSRWLAVSSLGRNGSPSFWRRRRLHLSRSDGAVRMSALLLIAALLLAAAGCGLPTTKPVTTRVGPIPKPVLGLASSTPAEKYATVGPQILVDFVDEDRDGLADPFVCLVDGVRMEADSMGPFKRILVERLLRVRERTGLGAVSLQKPVGFNPPFGLRYQIEPALNDAGFRVTSQW